MNTKLLIYFVCSMLLLCGCELGTDRVYMEMYEAMNANSDVIENSIQSKIRTMQQEVKKKPDYKTLVPAAHAIEESALDFIKFIDRIDERLDERDFKAINDDEIKSKIIAHRHKIIDVLKALSGNKTLWIKDEEIQNLIKLHFFPNDILPLINGKPFDDYSFENQSIACNKAMFAKQKNDALMLAKVTVNYLASKVGSITFGCSWDRPVVVSSPKTTFITKGETFETDIFLYFHHSVYNHRIKLMAKVNDKEVSVRGGVATYKTTPRVYGKYKYKVEMSFINPFNNKSETYHRTFSFEVGERCY